MKLFLVTRGKKKITKARRHRHHCLGSLGFIQSTDQQAASFFRVVMSLDCPFVHLGTLRLEHLKSPGPRTQYSFLHIQSRTLQCCADLQMAWSVPISRRGWWLLCSAGGWGVGTRLLLEAVFFEVTWAVSE